MFNKGFLNNKEITLFEKEKAMCKIITDIIENNKKIQGTGSFIKLDNMLGLLTNNHILSNTKIDDTIHLNYLSQYKKIEITDKRRIYTNNQLDYTFIEIFPEDNIKDYFKKYPNDIINLKEHDIFILQYPNNVLSFSYGQIKSINENEIRYNASTDHGSSGAPIILRTNDNYVIGLHYGGLASQGKFKYNTSNSINSILRDIQIKKNKYKHINPTKNKIIICNRQSFNRN